MGGSSSKPVKYLPEFEDNLPSLEKKVVAITGCTSGTGLVAAKASVRKGAATVLLLNRPSPRAENAEKEVRAQIPEGQATTVETIPCDLQDFDSVRAAAKQIKGKYKAIDVLCNNAGVMALDDNATKDGYDVQMQTNHLSHFLLTKELFPLLQKAKELRGEARIACHSSMARNGSLLEAKFFGKNGGNLGGNSGSMFSGGGKWERYHQSKLANVVFTLALHDKLKGTGIKATCAAPGYSVTSLQTSSQGMNGAMWTSIMAQSAEDGTMPILQACYGPTVESGDFWEPGNRGNTVGPAVKVILNNECTDEASRKMLWEASEKACGAFKI
jgi:NAD(P)-dependent dehydrogenase (short-subunit alcohol dehydrogenase family)